MIVGKAPIDLAVADRIEVLVLVDNVTDNLSTVPRFVENEMPRLARRGLRLWSGQCMCCAAHGFSCAVTAWHGDVSRTLLFDTGPDDRVFERNVDRLGFDMATVDGIVLSHGHWDHAGALLRALEMAQLATGGRPLPTYMHPGMYRSRAIKSAASHEMLPFADVPKPEELARQGAEVIHATAAQVILDDLFFVSGEIPRVTEFETGLPGHYRRSADGTQWESDSEIMDERFVALRVEAGVVVLTACSHAGAVNVMTHARECFPGVPMHAVIGGFHLAGGNERIIPDTVAALAQFELSVIAPAHCTGWRAVGALSAAFGEAVTPAAVGRCYRF
jgi:7,8-dihydropterin-6-yl-methyl-4-(beta-D-ribofuranosyl)aminobenzene 5'-phosphate synthase